MKCSEPLDRKGPRREGDRFTVSKGATLPPYCVRCGTPVSGEPKTKTYYWHHPALYFLILAGLLIYVIVALAVRKSIALAVPLCDEHLRKRRNLRLAALITFVAFVALLAIGMASGNKSFAPFACIGGVVAMLASMVLLNLADKTIRPTQISETSAEFAGAAGEFLERLR